MLADLRRLILLCAVTHLAYAGLQANMAAVVGDHVITEHELQQQIQLIKPQTQGQDVSTSQLRHWALEALLNRQVQLQGARAMGLSVSQQDLHRTLLHLAKQQKRSLKQLQQGWSRELGSWSLARQRLKEDMLIARYQHLAMRDIINIDDQQIEHAVQQAVGQTRVQLSDWHTQSSLTQAQALVTQLRRLKGQAKHVAPHLKQVFQVHDQGWVHYKDLPDAFEKALLHQAKMNVVGPVQTGNGWHVLVVHARHAPHVDRDSIHNALFEAALHQQIPDWIQQERQKIYIHIAPHAQA